MRRRKQLRFIRIRLWERTPVTEPPERRITGFHQDDEGHWVAELSCGHGRHVRHQPPFRNRAWTQTAEGRTAMLGQPLACRKCLEPETFGPPAGSA